MALVDNAWYVNYGDGSAGAGKKSYFDVAQWAALTVYAAGALVRQLAAPAVGSERVFVCIVAGTSLAAEPSWTLTRGAKTAEAAGPTWQECTGIAALNGDAANTPSWTITATPPGGVKNTAVTLGQVIKRDSGASYQIATTAGTAGNGAEPAFSNTAGTTTADNTVTWTSLGVVGNFTGWQAPHARIANALTATWGQAGNTFYVANNHAETQSTANTLAFPGTSASPNFTYCVDRAGSLPPVSADLKTTGSVTTTGNSNLSITTGIVYIYGITFNAGTGVVAATLSIASGFNSSVKLENCALNKAGTTGTSTAINLNNNVGQVILINTTMQFGAVTDSVNPSRGVVVWENTPSAIQGATLPTSLFNGGGSGGSAPDFFIRGIDLSALSGKTLVSTVPSSLRFVFQDCKLPASVTVSGTPTVNVGGRVDAIRCDSGATNYRDERYNYQGTQTVETTIIRTGGATDGTTPISWKLVSTANSKWVYPFEAQPIVIWNERTTAITTLTIYGTTTGGGVPNNDDIWVEVEYLGSSLTPQGSFITTTKADNLAASVTTNNSADASVWGGGGAGNGFKMVVPSFTPGMKGPFNIIIHVAKATSTYYIDPKPVIT
jgi:hypothetical protein